MYVTVKCDTPLSIKSTTLIFDDDLEYQKRMQNTSKIIKSSNAKS